MEQHLATGTGQHQRAGLGTLPAALPHQGKQEVIRVLGSGDLFGVVADTAAVWQQQV